MSSACLIISSAALAMCGLVSMAFVAFITSCKAFILSLSAVICSELATACACCASASNFAISALALRSIIAFCLACCSACDCSRAAFSSGVSSGSGKPIDSRNFIIIASLFGMSVKPIAVSMTANADCGLPVACAMVEANGNNCSAKAWRIVAW